MTHALSGLTQSGINLRLKIGGRDFLIDQLINHKADLVILAHDYQHNSIDKAAIFKETLIPVATPEWALNYL